MIIFNICVFMYSIDKQNMASSYVKYFLSYWYEDWQQPIGKRVNSALELV